MRRTSSWLPTTLALLALADGSAPLAAVSGRAYSAGSDPMGKESRLLPTAAALLIPIEGDTVADDNAEIGCSATLIGCSTVLTAAHCVEGLGPEGIRVLLRHGGIYPVTDVAVHPRYERDDADVAVLRLGEPVTGIVPSPINDRVDGADLIGSRGIIAGFGISTEDVVDSGIQRSGVVETGSCEELSEGDVSDRNFVCWQYDGPLGAPGHRANTCSGDSGGPLFVEVDGRLVVAGITSGGTGAKCGSEEMSYNANVYTWRSFVQAHMEGDTAEACGALPTVGGAGVVVVDRAARLAEGSEVRYAFEVGPGARELRLVLNGQDDGEFDPDLYVVRGDDADGERFDCARDAATAFADCRLERPAAGDWTVVVRAASGEGLYQLTGTLFGGTMTADAGDLVASDGDVWAAGGGGDDDDFEPRGGDTSASVDFDDEDAYYDSDDADDSVDKDDMAAFGDADDAFAGADASWGDDGGDSDRAVFAPYRSRQVERRGGCEACKDPASCQWADGSLDGNR
jgi:hypothetical protein